MRNARCLPTLALLLLPSLAAAQQADRGKLAVTHSPFARLRPATMDEASWTNGFWANRFQRSGTQTIPAVEQGLLNPQNSEQLDVLLIAAGLKDGDRKPKGTNWTDGDCYKWIEAMARHYSVTGDPAWLQKMDHWIDVINLAQSPDGYLSTNFWNDPDGRLQKPYFHELYNMGHLLTAASVHYQATGQTSFLEIAVKNADFLYEQFSPRPPRLVHFPWNPSIYMGLIDLYRATGDKKYLQLTKIMIDNRGSSPGGGTHRNGGTDQTQDRVPFTAESKAVGHAVCATYLYCGATDLYAETGEQSVLDALQRIWQNVTSTNMFLTGGVGAGSGHSIRGDPVHEAFLDEYYLPNECYAETCANIGNAMWNWRLANVTGEARFADVMEQVLYNAGLSPVNIQQDRFFYCNPLQWNADRKSTHTHRTATRWNTSDCYCCPPQMARTLSSLQTWAYSLAEGEVRVNLYGGSRLRTTIFDEGLELIQHTDYPWNGDVTIQVGACPSQPFAISVRIPGWCDNARVTINGQAADARPQSGRWLTIDRAWREGDTIELDLAMPVRLIESHPSVIDNRNRVAVMRGPLLYCVELPLRDGGKETWNQGIYFPENIRFQQRYDRDLLGGVVVLEGEALTTAGKDRFVEAVVAPAEACVDPRSWEGTLYRPFHGRDLPAPTTGKVSTTMIPYYAWANRGEAFMQVWTPLAR